MWKISWLSSWVFRNRGMCAYILEPGCRYMSLIWGLSILELGFLFQSSNDHVGSVPSRCSVIVYFAIGVKPECSGIFIPPWHAQTNPRFGSHVYSRLVVKPKKPDSKILLVLQHQQRHVMLFLFLFMRSTQLKHMKLFTVKKLCACQDIDPISSKKMSKISDLCCSKRCLAKAECFDWEINTYAKVRYLKIWIWWVRIHSFSLMALYPGWLRKAEVSGRKLWNYKASEFVFPFESKVSLVLAIFYSYRHQLHLSSHLRKITGLRSYFPEIWVSPHVTRTLVGSGPTKLNHGVMVSVSDISNAKAARLTLVAFIHFLNFWLFCNTAVLLRLHCILAVSYVSWIVISWCLLEETTIKQFHNLTHWPPAKLQNAGADRVSGISWQTSVSMSRNAINFWSSLRWAGKDCWQPCGNVSGDCAWCGAGNACCRFNAEHDPDECTGFFGGRKSWTNLTLRMTT